MRDGGIPWMYEGLDLVGALEEGTFMLRGIEGSDAAAALEEAHLSSEAAGTSLGGSGGPSGSPRMGGLLYGALDGDVLTGALPSGGLRDASQLRVEYEDGMPTNGSPFAFPPLTARGPRTDSDPADPTRGPPLSPASTDPRFETVLDLDGLPLLDDLPPLRLPRRDRSGTLSVSRSAADCTTTSGWSTDASPTRSHSALTPAFGSHSQVSPDTDTESVPHCPPGVVLRSLGGHQGGPAADGSVEGMGAVPQQGSERGYGFGAWGALTQGGSVASPGSQDAGDLAANTDPLARLPRIGPLPIRSGAAGRAAKPRAPRAARRPVVRKRRLFRDADRITIPSAEFREQITNPRNCLSLPPLLAAASEARRRPVAVDEDSFDMALAWRRLPQWESIPRAMRAFVLSRGHLFHHQPSSPGDPTAASDPSNAPLEDTPSIVAHSQSSHPPGGSPGFVRSLFGVAEPLPAPAARIARAAARLVADPADIDLPDPPHAGAAWTEEWLEEARIAQLLRSGARPFAGGGGDSGSDGEVLASRLLKGLESREFSVEELRALSSSKGTTTSSLGTPAIERLRALAGSGALVDALGNTVTAAQIWGKRGRDRDLDSLSNASRDDSDDSQAGLNHSPPLLGPIRVLPTLREELEEPQDSLMRDTPMDAPSPPLLDTVAPPSPLPQFPLPHPPSSGRGAGSEAQGFDTEEFLTQRAPMRPSQVVTEQTMVVHSWLQAERDRQSSMCKRRRLGGGVAEVPPPDEVSLLSGTSRLTRSDAAKAFYQALVLQSCHLVQLEQSVPYGDITVTL